MTIRENRRVRPRNLMVASVALFLLMARPDVAPAAPPALTRGPYLQQLTTSSVTIVWNTDTPAACSLVIRPLDDGPTLINGDTGTVCAIPVAGLTPGTPYAYIPFAGNVQLRSESVFQTDDPTAPFSFMVLGDSGSGSPDQFAVRDAMLKSVGDFILHVGDVIYNEGLAEDYDPKFFSPYADLLRERAFWPCLGNHDVLTNDGAPWYDAFYTPANNPAGDEDYYSFDHGNAHVVVLDTTKSLQPGSPQYTFLDEDLAASAATWKFVALYHAIYSSGRHGGGESLQADLVPLIDRYGVDIVFNGHDHDYERTLPLRNDALVGPGEGTVYITTGGGGGELRRVDGAPFTAYAESTFHFTRVVVGGDWLLEQMIREDGSIGDAMTLVKGTPPPPARCGDGIVNRAQEECDGSDRAICVQDCAPDCTCLPVCGDGSVNRSAEECDRGDDAACPRLCRSDCRCGATTDFVYLTPVADTFVEGDDETTQEATWDHGASEFLEVDTGPTAITYLKFDLSGVTVPVSRATLTLSCRNGSETGGTIYPVTDSSWIEGDHKGQHFTSAQGPGLTLAEVDTNGDGLIDGRDTSRYVPDFAHPLAPVGPVIAGEAYAVEVTPAFQEGAALHTLAIVTENTNGVRYSSREAGQPSEWPILRLELIDEVEDGGCTSDTDCDDGDPCNGAEVCDSVTGCQPGTPIDCSDDPGCASNADCDDGDPCNGVEVCDAVTGCQPGTSLDCRDDDGCTHDVCIPTVGCRHIIDPGVDGADCEVARLLASNLCAPDVLDARIGHIIEKKVQKARKLLAKSAGMTKEKQLRRTLKKVDRVLRVVLKKTNRSRKVPAQCRAAIGDVVAEARRAAKNLSP